MDIKEKNNQVKVAGEVMSNFEFSHEVRGEKFYGSKIRIPRTSGTDDIIPIMVSDRLVDVSEEWTGSLIAITGQFRSCNKQMPDGRRKLELFVFVFSAEAVADVKDIVEDNHIILNGFLCKKPIARTTPLGREIADILLAVNRSYGKSDYIPCICWGRNTSYISKFDVGASFNLEGRIQSRPYRKILEDGTVEERIAYEVSVQSIQLI